MEITPKYLKDKNPNICTKFESLWARRHGPNYAVFKWYLYVRLGSGNPRSRSRYQAMRACTKYLFRMNFLITFLSFFQSDAHTLEQPSNYLWNCRTLHYADMTTRTHFRAVSKCTCLTEPCKINMIISCPHSYRKKWNTSAWVAWDSKSLRSIEEESAEERAPCV